MPFFLQGLTMGLAYVAPIGLQNIFVINSALSSGFPKSLITAVIVTFFDITLALACFFGIGIIMQSSFWLKEAILLGGSIIVMIIGVKLVATKPAKPDEKKTENSIKATIYSACVVTWCNPQAIIDGTMMLGAFHASLPDEGVIPFITGTMSASFLWFTALTMIISAFRRHLSEKVLHFVNIICGIIITAYGLKLFAAFIVSIGALIT